MGLFKAFCLIPDLSNRQINMDKEKEGGLTAEEASQLDQQILALENSLKVCYVPFLRANSP